MTALSSFLRYLHFTGVTDAPLAAALPKVAGYRRIAPESVDLTVADRVLAACDRGRSVGRRDYAMLMLLSRLGLRAGEVAGLRLDDIDWRHGELVVRGKGGRCDVLPLPPDVGDALAEYLHEGRGQVPTGCRSVFMFAQAPEGGVTTSVVRNRVAAAARRAGIAQRVGLRMLRRCAATAILRRGAGLPEVAQILRHNNIQTTLRYAAVDPRGIGEVARPWPGAR